jgi:hypothetical protein
VPPFQRNPICEVKQYIPYTDKVEDIDERLIEVLAYQTAKNVLISFGGDATLLENKVKEIIELL